MSQPKRYYPMAVEVQSEMIDDNDGDWVRYSDYAALAAENERLRKAGDALAILQCAESDEQHKRRCLVNWLAAKEGRDAK